MQENLFLGCCSLSSSLSPAIAKVLVSGLPTLQSNKYFSENQLLNLKCSVIYFHGEGLHFPSHYVINVSCVVWYCLPLCKVQRPVTVKKPSALSKLVCCNYIDSPWNSTSWHSAGKVLKGRVEERETLRRKCNL